MSFYFSTNFQLASAKKAKREHGQYLKNFFFDDVKKNKGF